MSAFEPSVDNPAAVLAQAALDEVGRDPQRALAQADDAVAAARRYHDPAASSTAHRAAALAHRELGDLTRSASRARTGVRCAVRAGSAQHEAEARMSLAFVLLESGRLRAAYHQADRAGAAVTGLAAARVASQRAVILQRSGRLDEALASYASALPVFRRHQDRLWEARLLNNRGRLHTDQGNLTQATADLTACRTLLLAAGMTALAADAEWNLAVVATFRGDVPLALARFDAVRAEHVARGTPNPQLQVDRGETLLSVGLNAEARIEAEEAVAALIDSGQHADLPHAELLLAQAMAATGEHAEARAGALRARALFTRQHRAGWASLATLTALRAAEHEGPGDDSLFTEALECADEVHRSGWPIAEMEARIIAARAAERLGRRSISVAQLELVAGHRRLGSIDARLRGHYAHVLLREASDDRRGTMSALVSGLRVLDEHQALLGATELRAQVSAVGADLVRKGLDLALAAGNARSVLQWADRGRARATRPRPVRPPHDPELTLALSEVRRLQARTLEARLDGGVAPSAAERRHAERQVVLASRKIRGSGANRAEDASPPELVAELGAGALVEFVEHDGQIVLVVCMAGRFRLHRLGGSADLDGEIARLHFLLRRLATGFGSARSRSGHRDDTVLVAADLQRRLFGPVLDRIGDRELVIVPSASLHGLPWSLLPGLASRAFRVAPSATAWVRATQTPRSAATRQVFVAGPGLHRADDEVVELGRRVTDAQVFRHIDATAADVLAALDGAALAHIAAHGQLRSDNPLFSALLLIDGPLTVYDLEGLRVAPQTVVLPACESGVSAARAGDELLGLVAALLSIGTRSVIATGIATPDAATAELMLLLHDRLRAGDTPATALAGARAAADRSDPAMFATAAGFTCFGA